MLGIDCSLLTHQTRTGPQWAFRSPAREHLLDHGRSKARDRSRTPLLLGDHETARDTLQVFVLVLPNPQRGLRVTQAVRYDLHRLVVQHARLPGLLNGFQPVEYDRWDRDRVLEPLRDAQLLVGYPKVS